MKNFKTFEEAIISQRENYQPNSVLETGVQNIDRIQFSLGDVLWVIMADGYQDVNFGLEAQKEMLRGAKILADAVRSTMGPSGQNVIIDSEKAAPLITKDGVTVAKSINLKNKLPAVGAELLKEVDVFGE